jgi:N-acetylmuramoyl-L-alanine amidase
VNDSSSTSRQTLSILLKAFGLAIFLATLFTAWSPTGLFEGGFSEKLALFLTPQAENVPVEEATPLPMQIGIVSGHWGHDSGAVCRDAQGNVILTEMEVNLKIATLVQKMLREDGFQVDLLQEFDPRLNGYHAAALVSIHNDSCEYINDDATGFKVAAALNSRDYNRTSRLTACLVDRYGRETGLPFHAGSITSDMRDYHAFSEIDGATPAAIIEAGFLYLDHDILVNHPEIIAKGIVQGILCFVHNESIEPTVLPSASP